MLKKSLIVMLILVFMFLESCGTIFKYKYINEPITNKPDWGIIALDGIGVILFIVPGVLAFTIDYMTGTLFLPQESINLSNLSTEDMQKVLKEHNINITLDQLKDAKKLAFTL